MRSTLLHRRHLLTIGATVSLGVGLVSGATPAAAGAPGVVYLSFDAGAPVSGLPTSTRLTLQGYAPQGLAAEGSLRLVRTTAAGHIATEVWTTQGQTTTCTKRLTTCSISGADLGVYGTATLAFSPTSPLHVKTLTCAKTGKPYVTTRTRRGVLTGTLRLATHNAAYGTVRNKASAAHHVPARIPVTMKRSTFGPLCPGGTGEPAPCTSAFLLESDIGANAMRLGKRGFVAAQMTVPSIEPGVSITASAVVRGTGAALLSIDSTPDPLLGATLTIPANPFLAGGLTFTSHGPLETFGGDCPGERRPGYFEGTVTLTLPGLPATGVPTTGGMLSHFDG